VIGDPANGNRYAYAGDDPTNNVDPNGRCFLGLFGGNCGNIQCYLGVTLILTSVSIAVIGGGLLIGLGGT
jgi:hypothetical protein